MTHKNPAHLKGVSPRGRRFTSRYTTRGKTLSLGTHETEERASIAVRLFSYWCRRGFRPEDIPREPTCAEFKGETLKRVSDDVLDRVIDSRAHTEIWVPSNREILEMAREIKYQRSLLLGNGRRIK